MRVWPAFGRRGLKHGLTVIVLLLVMTQVAVATRAVELSIKGSIGPATADYIVRGIAKAQDATLIIIQIDTPGGLDKSTRQMVQSILTSHVPIVVYVAPDGARAASAGTYLLYASTIAAMAPGTNLGAASPVSLANGMGAEDNKQKTTLDKKVTNDAVAYIRTLAQLRGRNIVFAQDAVRNAATLTATEALQAKVINILAKNRTDLLNKLDGLLVTQDGQQIKLATANISVESIDPDWRMNFLQVITEPTIAYLLLLLGVYGIFFELINPGFVAPGVIGGIAVLVALYALQLLPVNYAGLGLIVLGMAFIVAETFAPSFGVLGLGGACAFIIGSILLIDTEYAAYQIAWSAIGAMAVVNILFFIIVLGMMRKARRKPIQHGTDMLIGAQGRALGSINLQGQAIIHGEIWSVYTKQQPIEANESIKVIAAKGLRLEVIGIAEKE